MATLKHDAQGFLVGDAIDLERSRSLAAMRNDVRAIRAGVAGIASLLAHAQTVPRVGSRAAVVPQPAPRVDSGRRPASAQPPQRPSAVPVASEVRAARTMTHHAVAQPRNRDSRGRFIGTSGQSTSQPVRHPRTAPGAGAGVDDEEEGRLHDFAERLVGAIKESSVGMEEADPAIKAFREVAQPMARGYELLSGGDKQKRQEGWLRRIYASLTGFRKDESAFSKAAAKRLKSLDEKPAAKAGGDSGWLGTLGAMLKRIPGVGTLTAGAGKFLSGGGGLLAGVARGVLGFGKGMLRRLPFIGSLLSGIGAASEIYDTETDDAMSRREKDKHDGAAVGGFAGTVGGMFAGAKVGALLGSFAGPIGTAIGGAVGGAAGMFFGDQAGQIIGDKVGEWVTDLREADIPGKITAAWDATTETLRKAWDSALARLSEGWQSVKKAGQKAGNWVATQGDAANDFVKDKTGVDIKGAASRVWSSVSKTVKDFGTVVERKAVNGIKHGAQWAATHSTAGRGVSTLLHGAQSIGGGIAARWRDAKRYLLGASEKAGVDAGTVAKIANFESGFNAEAAPIRKDGTRISSAHGYGQFLDSTWTDMLNKYGAKYGVAGAGRLTRDQAAKYRSDKTVQAGMLAEFTRENIEKGRKYGGADDDANVYAFHNLGDRDAKSLLKGMQRDPSMTVRDALLQGARNDKQRARIEAVISGNKSLYGDGSVTAAEAYARMGKMMRRGDAFASDVRQAQDKISVADVGASRSPKPAAPAVVAAAPMPVAPVGIAAPGMPIVASARVPAVPSVPAVPAVAEAPRIDVPLASGDRHKPVVVTPAPSDVNQDLRERGIAHIVTGGLGA
ncbi:hypothetical protein [Burkholderia plantarii]|uniref:Phage tail lysozyme domain-containing protein n=1 Tax=Burkholderia plantarii TaxID=41899 RepID=A0A0B6S1Y8_BURPL|nr:hypothetical protein [Burkholderia plantarii]AJK46251.1 hypothetical protein BGL_1c17420 [Burkholderia plantarii]